MLPATTTRVVEQTAPHVNEKIRQNIEANVARYSAQGPQAIERRLAELDREWDIERALEVNASIASLLGLGLGAFVRRRWFILPVIVGGFLLQHALQGWCPPVPVFRRLGMRTSTEIDYERYALKALKGDFQNLATKRPSNGEIVDKALQAVRA
jgi:hypothetical protein